MPKPTQLRSALFVPASNARAIAKARTLDADAIIFDLEDSVADDAKADARHAIADALAHGGFGDRMLIVRINAATSPWASEDVAAIAAMPIDAVLLPKVEAVPELHAIRRQLSALDRSSLPLWAMIETARGIINLRACADQAATLGLSGLVAGPNDLARTTGVDPGPSRQNLVPWLLEIVLVGRAYGLHVLDGVFNRFDDPVAFEADCIQGRSLGFQGKTLIHPTQIAIANRAFLPDDARRRWAEAVVAAFARPEAQALNVISLEGEMVERLHLLIAQEILKQGN